MKYRIKPVIVNVWEFKGRNGLGNVANMPNWVADIAIFYAGSDSISVAVPDRGGELEVQPGDLLIQGTNGEVYPCKPEIFAMIYDKVEENAEIDA